ncbi:hypothetical protein NE865_01245 [Phthorimaea operculella]|nr:hypothetical protein NE865_01245 [Phthorimaea operculella]
MQSISKMPEKLEDVFNKPIESIMRCEDFKSNFARRLSNRYTSRSSIISQPNSDTSLKLRPLENSNSGNVSPCAPERIEQNPQLSKIAFEEQNGEAVKPPDKAPILNSDINRTEVTVLNMEVETLRWQLAQTEANRQMHIALLKQIVTFLNRVKDHIKQQNMETNIRKDVPPGRLLPRSFNVADLPRSRSVVHVNKGHEYTLSTTKKISTRKISKSISNVNGFKDINSTWTQTKPEEETNQKISEEMSRLITLANTVLSTKIPDLACSCNDTQFNLVAPMELNTENITSTSNQNDTSLSQIKEDTVNVSKENEYFLTIKEPNNNLALSLSSLRGYEMDESLLESKSPERKQSSLFLDGPSVDLDNRSTTSSAEKRNDMNSSFIEDESGFSSMSSFQEIGIPIISIIPPSPSKDVGFLDEIPDLLDDLQKWKTDTIELEKQTMKVFWV